jgi:16S rRNA processing protein RimM
LRAIEGGPWAAAVVEQTGGQPPTARLRGMQAREQAAALVHWELWLRRSDFPPLAPDEHYVADLVGMAVLDAAGATVGRVTDVWNGPVHDNLVIVTNDGEELMIPLVAAHVAGIDAVARVVHLTERPIRA